MATRQPFSFGVLGLVNFNAHSYGGFFLFFEVRGAVARSPYGVFYYDIVSSV